MILNHFEYALMNSPLRTVQQRYFAAKRLLKMGGTMRHGTALEIGCGRGMGIEIILDLFGAAHVDAFDLDPRMITLAQNRLARRIDRVTLWQGDATYIEATDNYYDVVFDFGIIHHIPDWQKALLEAYRVLKPGGCFCAEEVLSRLITHWSVRRILGHPQENRFNHEQFCKAMENSGFYNVNSNVLFGCYGLYIAKKPEHSNNYMSATKVDPVIP